MQKRVLLIMLLFLGGCAAYGTEQLSSCSDERCVHDWYQYAPPVASAQPAQPASGPLATLSQMPPQPPYIEWLWWKHNAQSHPTPIERRKATGRIDQG
jgi:hypothetical protein